MPLPTLATPMTTYDPLLPIANAIPVPNAEARSNETNDAAIQFDDAVGPMPEGQNPIMEEVQPVIVAKKMGRVPRLHSKRMRHIARI